MGPETSELTIVLAVLLGLLFLLLLGGSLWMRISQFCDKLRYINIELQRCSVRERALWRRRRRRLWRWLFFLSRG